MRKDFATDGEQGAKPGDMVRGPPDGDPGNGGYPTQLMHTLHEMLADGKQRRLLYHLVANGEADPETLVDVLEAASPDDPSRHELRGELKETLLPPMLDADIVSIDTERGMVQLQFLPHNILEWLQTERRDDQT